MAVPPHLPNRACPLLDTGVPLSPRRSTQNVRHLQRRVLQGKLKPQPCFHFVPKRHVRLLYPPTGVAPFAEQVKTDQRGGRVDRLAFLCEVLSSVGVNDMLVNEFAAVVGEAVGVQFVA